MKEVSDHRPVWISLVAQANNLESHAQHSANASARQNGAAVDESAWMVTHEDSQSVSFTHEDMTTESVLSTPSRTPNIHVDRWGSGHEIMV